MLAHDPPFFSILQCISELNSLHDVVRVRVWHAARGCAAACTESHECVCCMATGKAGCVMRRAAFTKTKTKQMTENVSPAIQLSSDDSGFVPACILGQLCDLERHSDHRRDHNWRHLIELAFRRHVPARPFSLGCGDSRRSTVGNCWQRRRLHCRRVSIPATPASVPSRKGRIHCVCVLEICRIDLGEARSPK